MKAFQRFLTQQAERAEQQNDGLVESLLQRVSESVLVGDRREALAELRDLLADSPPAQLAFGTIGFPTVAHVVREREDIEMVRSAVECMNLAVGGQAPAGSGKAEPHPGAINAQQLARSPDGAALLLTLLEEEPVGLADFYVRYHALQALRGLAAAAPGPLQEAVLGAPLAVVKLMDCLAEQEVLRNEALLLLQQLAASSCEVQKIAVFESAFDRLFGIMREEGFLEGGIVVQDCLLLLAALLRGSPPNQLMFRETGHLAQLPPLLAVHPPPAAHTGVQSGESEEGEGLGAQKAANLAALLELVLLLVSPAPPAQQGTAGGSHLQNQAALLQQGLLEALVELAVGGGGAPDATVRSQGLRCLAAIVAVSQASKDKAAAVAVRGAQGGGSSLPLLHAALRALLQAQEPAEGVAADALLEAYCAGNAEGQAVLASSISQAAPAGTFGGDLLGALQGGERLGEVVTCGQAAAALSHLVSGSPGFKPHLLAIQLPQQQPAAPAGGNSVIAAVARSLGATCTTVGQQPASLQAAANLLRLLLVWLSDCPAAVTAFLRAVAQSRPFLVDAIRGSNACSGGLPSGHAVTRGMLALLLGLCASQAEAGAGTPTQQQLLDAIAAQIGQAKFADMLDEMLQHPDMAAARSSPITAGPSGVWLGASFASWLPGVVAQVRQRVLGGSAAPAAPPMAALPAFQTFHAPAPPSFGGPAAPVALQPLPATTIKAAAAHGYSSPQHAALPPPAASPRKPAAPSVFAAPPPAPPSPAKPAAASMLPAAPLIPSSSGADAQQLQRALATVEALQREVDQLQARNRSLAEDLLRVSTGGSASPLANGHAALAEAERRATRAEQASAVLQQQLEAARAEAEALQQDADRAREAAEEARSAAAKADSDLADLSSAYSSLDAHASSLQQRVEDLEQQQQQRAVVDIGGGSGSSGGVPEAEVQQRMDAAAAAAREEAQNEGDEAMTDLLVCLGQEEAKVARLREQLQAFGVDCDLLLADILAAGDAGGEEEDLL